MHSINESTLHHIPNPTPPCTPYTLSPSSLPWNIVQILLWNTNTPELTTRFVDYCYHFICGQFIACRIEESTQSLVSKYFQWEMPKLDCISKLGIWILHIAHILIPLRQGRSQDCFFYICTIRREKIVLVKFWCRFYIIQLWCHAEKCKDTLKSDNHACLVD